MAEIIDVFSDSEDDIVLPVDQTADDWTCAACTLLNQSGFLACEACGAERPNLRAGGGAVANGAAAPPQQGADQQAPTEADSPGSRWTCGTCTFGNSCSIAECEMCGALGPEAVVAAVAAAAAAAAAAADADAAGPSCPAQSHGVLGQMTASGGATGVPALDGLYTLDCGCRLPATELQRHLLAAATLLPQRLPALARHFCCPQQRCQQPLTHRDLEAVLGGQEAGKVAAHAWIAAANESGASAAAAPPRHPSRDGEGSGADGIIDLACSPRATAGPAARAGEHLAGAAAAAAAGDQPEAVQRCAELAGLLLQLHSVLVDSKLPAKAAEDGNGRGQGKGPRRQERSSGGGKAADMQADGLDGSRQHEQRQLGAEAEATSTAGSGRRRGRSAKQQSTAGPPAKKHKKTWQQQNPPPFVKCMQTEPSAGIGYDGDEYDDEEYGEGYDSVEGLEADGMFGGAFGAMLGSLMGGGYGGGYGRGAQAKRPQGVGYGGGMSDGRGGANRARKQREDAVQRQQQLDEAAAGLLKQLSQHLQSWAEEAHERLAPPPLLLLAALRGGPLAPLLRMLLQNDSLMDVSGRRELYREVFGLVAALAGSPDLLPLLLLPADSDLLKCCVPQEAQQAQQVQHLPERPRDAAAAAAGKKGRQPSRGKGSASPAPAAKAAEAGGAEGQAAADAPPAADTSCWDALQALRLQADIFRRNAEQLAAEGDEEDLQLVGAILDVSECCQRVQQAVDLWQASTGQGGAAAGQKGGDGEQQAQQRQQQPAAAADSPELRQQYQSSLKPLLFQSLPLLQGHYYRQHAATGGGLSDRLRRITKELATLPGQLPLSWESAVLAAMDEDNMGVLRAVVFAPHDTPYACGAFAFDILLPADYPNCPPQVHFLTTGGGHVRFNPNLYNDGKVCLSLLGTWAGPSWQPGQSTLLQVLVSIQSMILGTQDPYYNEPGYASMEGSAQGRSASQHYNRDIRRHTLQVAILGQLQRPPAGFEEAIRLHFRLKAGVIKEQVRQWAREDSSLKQLAAQVITALDAAAEGAE